MEIYVVGGAVRDELLGLDVQDRDYVVVGATPEELVKQGFKPVGKDFPVFLHPVTREEYALARTERKTAPGYKGFVVHAAPDVTLEDDLARRDLTINAIAQDQAGNLIDPFHGADDLRAGILRHVGPAFVEDPVRVLRLARFAARYGFAVAPETFALLQRMVAAGEVDALVPERVWQELAKGLAEAAPRRMFEVLASCGALERIVPEWSAMDAPRALGALDEAARQRLPLPERYAALFGGAAPEVAERVADRLRAPSDCRELAHLTARLQARLDAAPSLGPAALVDLLQQADAIRRPDRFEALLRAWACDAKARGRDPMRALARLRSAADAARTVDAGAIAAARPADVAEAIRTARVAAVAAIAPSS